MSNENRLNDFSEDFDSEELENADSIDELPHNRKDEKELDERNKVYTKILNNSCEILYLIFDYPHKHYTFKYFEV